MEVNSQFFLDSQRSHHCSEHFSLVQAATPAPTLIMVVIFGWGDRLEAKEQQGKKY